MCSPSTLSGSLTLRTFSAAEACAATVHAQTAPQSALTATSPVSITRSFPGVVPVPAAPPMLCKPGCHDRAGFADPVLTSAPVVVISAPDFAQNRAPTAP